MEWPLSVRDTVLPSFFIFIVSLEGNLDALAITSGLTVDLLTRECRSRSSRRNRPK